MVIQHQADGYAFHYFCVTFRESIRELHCMSPCQTMVSNYYTGLIIPFAHVIVKRLKSQIHIRLSINKEPAAFLILQRAL